MNYFDDDAELAPEPFELGAAEAALLELPGASRLESMGPSFVAPAFSDRLEP